MRCSRPAAWTAPNIDVHSLHSQRSQRPPVCRAKRSGSWTTSSSSHVPHVVHPASLASLASESSNGLGCIEREHEPCELGDLLRRIRIARHERADARLQLDRQSRQRLVVAVARARERDVFAPVVEAAALGAPAKIVAAAVEDRFERGDRRAEVFIAPRVDAHRWRNRSADRARHLCLRLTIHGAQGSRTLTGTRRLPRDRSSRRP
jgi:hypothetical protein